MHRWLPNIGLPSAFVDKIQDVLLSFKKVRAHVTNYDDAGPAVTTWMAGMNESSTVVIELLEHLVYGNVFDARYKDANKNNMAADEFLECDSVRTRIQEVKDAVQKASTQTHRRTNTYTTHWCRVSLRYSAVCFCIGLVRFNADN